MSTSGEPRLTESRDFSLALGGPPYQLFRRLRPAGNTLESLQRRISVLTGAPLLLTMCSPEQLLGEALKILF
jgi:hypothetical protein